MEQFNKYGHYIGLKDRIKLQVQRKSKMSKEGWERTPKWLHRKCDGIVKRFLPAITIETNRISDMDNLVKVVYDNYGCGRFNLLFRHRYNTNPRFHPCIKCCKKYNWGWTNPRRRHNKRKCRKNYINWKKRAEIEIFPIALSYDYKIYFNEMHKFWFFKNKRQR